MAETLLQQPGQRPLRLVESFDAVWLLDLPQALSASQWRYLWERYDLPELIALARRSGWLSSETNPQAAAILRRWAVQAGYEPPSTGPPATRAGASG